MRKLELADEYEDKGHFISLYTRAFPWKSHVRVVTCTNISTGWEGDILCLNLEYEEDHEQKSAEAILKLYHGQDGIRKARSEFQSLRLLGNAGYPVPRAMFAALETSPFGRAGVAMEKIQGQSAAHLIEQASQEHQRALLTRCCQLYVDLHTLNWETLVPDPAQYQTQDVIHAWFIWAKSMTEQWLPGVFDPVLTWLQERSSAITRQRLSILHGDFHLENVLIRDDRTLFVIDWTGTKVSDYRFDLAWTLLLQRSQGAGELAEALLREYERLAGHSIEHLEFFEVVACFKRLFEITVSLKSSPILLGIKPDAEEEMKQQLDRIQAVYAQLQQRIVHPLPEIENVIETLRCQTA